MKKAILLGLLLVSCVGYSQEVKQDSIYIVADKMPEYPDGGIKGFTEFVAENFQPLNNPEDITGTIISSFIIDTEGNLRNIEILRDLGYGTGEETIRVLNLSPRWTPGQIQGKNVNVKYTFPIRIEIKAAVIVDDEKVNNHFAMNSDGTYTEVETMPEYPDGGYNGFRRFVAKNFRAPEIIKNLKGQLILQFVVETDGSLTDIKVIRDLGYGTGAEAVRVLKKSKKWKPGTQNGKPVRVKYTLPIIINIQNSGVIGTPPKVDYNPPSYQNQYDNRRF